MIEWSNVILYVVFATGTNNTNDFIVSFSFSRYIRAREDSKIVLPAEIPKRTLYSRTPLKAYSKLCSKNMLPNLALYITYLIQD